jgi:hypothetical protein
MSKFAKVQRDIKSQVKSSQSPIIGIKKGTDLDVPIVAIPPMSNRKWAIHDDGRSGSYDLKEMPVGYIARTESITVNESHNSLKEQAEKDEKIYKSAMAAAMAPGSQLMMTAFMLWMSGSTLQVFSFFILGMAVMNPLRALADANNQFAKFADSKVNITLPFLIFIAINLAALGVAIYKLQTLGLLPETWGSVSVAPKSLEYSAGGVTVSAT